MNKLTRKIQKIVWIIVAGVLGLWIQIVLPANAEEEPVIVVIDPGHGGDNLGAEYEEYTEKDMTMIVALAMKEELEKYDSITVYLTRESDISMTIKDRALFAKEKNADFLFCLHFNSSVNHNLYGAEVWVSAFGDYYIQGRQFAEINMQIFEEMGLFSRGIKTRLNDEGDNYYGILRYCTEVGIPSALIEHCHLDQENDQPFYQQSEEQLKEFGRKDAEAVAKYFGLKSSETGKDYSGYPKADIPYTEVVKPDKTAPEECSIEVIDIDKEEGNATVSMHAVDYDSYIQYYSYSLDGGNTYSELLGWPRPSWNSSEPEYLFVIPLPFDQEIELRTIAYNGYDVFTESNIITIPEIPAPVISEEKDKNDEAIETFAESKESYREITYEPLEDPDAGNREKLRLIALILLISLIMTGILYIMFRMILKLKGHNKKHR
ncbi:MAG: N-acetylmuramoyl-L-alanine amidase [Suilimivivens sp.]